MPRNDNDMFLNKTIEYGTLAFVFLIPWQARWIIAPGQINNGYWEYGTISLYLTEILLLIVLLALVVKGVVYIRQVRPAFSVKNLKSPAGAVFLILIWSGLSVLWANNQEVAWEKFIVLVEAGAVFLILISGAISFKKLAWTIVLSGLVQAIWAITQFLLQSVSASAIMGMSFQSADALGASVVETGSGRWLRAYGSFPHPNILAGWLVLSLIILISDLKRPDSISSLKRGSRMTTFAIFIVLLFALLATFSRSAWLAFLLATIYYLLSTLSDKTSRIISLKIISIVALTVIIFASLFPAPFLSRLSGQGRLESMSTQERTSSISQSWQIIKQNPILGVGVGNYGLVVHQKIDSTQPAYFYQPVHNAPLLILAELGIIGTFLFTFSFFLLLRSIASYDLFILRSFSEGGRLTSLYFIPILTISLLDHYLWSLYSGVLITAVFLTLLFYRNNAKLF